MRKNRLFTTTKILKNFPISSVRSPPPSKNSGPLYSKWKVGASASVSCHFVCILFGSFCDHCKNVWYNLFCGRPSKVLPWSRLKKSWSWSWSRDPKSWPWSWSWSSESWSWSWQKSLIYITCENISNLFALPVLQMHLHRSCSLHQSGQSHSCRLHRAIQWSKWFDNSLNHNEGLYSHRILEPPKKTNSLTRYFAAIRADYEFSIVFRITIYTDWGRHCRQAKKPSCLTCKPLQFYC